MLALGRLRREVLPRLLQGLRRELLPVGRPVPLGRHGVPAARGLRRHDDRAVRQRAEAEGGHPDRRRHLLQPRLPRGRAGRGGQAATPGAVPRVRGAALWPPRVRRPLDCRPPLLGLGGGGAAPRGAGAAAARGGAPAARGGAAAGRPDAVPAGGCPALPGVPRLRRHGRARRRLQHGLPPPLQDQVVLRLWGHGLSGLRLPRIVCQALRDELRPRGPPGRHRGVAGGFARREAWTSHARRPRLGWKALLRRRLSRSRKSVWGVWCTLFSSQACRGLAELPFCVP
mmetsp:Transcript_110995/g.324671  ORF Transcript_110995/g.324671 Transcript_110995/m.324671 type:complete len:285 (-) Transcript_110995:168-1022(-)